MLTNVYCSVDYYKLGKSDENHVNQIDFMWSPMNNV